MQYKMGFNIEQVTKHWDKVAYKYDKENNHKLNPHNWRFIEGIKHIQPSQDKDIIVLSLWSRTGNAISYIRKNLPNSKIYNFEVSTNMINLAKKNYPKEIFKKTDLKKINVESNTIDYIISPETLEHTPEPFILIKEFYRVLKPGGKLILSLPPRIADLHQFIWETFVGGHGEGPRKGIPSRIVKNYLHEAGFNILKHKAILLFPIGPVWFIELGNKILNKFPLIRELGIMQFYICEK